MNFIRCCLLGHTGFLLFLLWDEEFDLIFEKRLHSLCFPMMNMIWLRELYLPSVLIRSFRLDFWSWKLRNFENFCLIVDPHQQAQAHHWFSKQSNWTFSCFLSMVFRTLRFYFFFSTFHLIFLEIGYWFKTISLYLNLTFSFTFIFAWADQSRSKGFPSTKNYFFPANCSECTFLRPDCWSCASKAPPGLPNCKANS